MRLVFWNCGVASSKKKRSSPRAAAAPEVVRELLQSGPAIVALCEADEELLDGLSTALELEKHDDYRPRAINDQAGGSHWDLAVLFDWRRMKLSQERPIIARNDGRILRAGYAVSITAEDEGLDFELFLAHWPSRLLGTGEGDRRCCAQALRARIEEELQDGKRVVVLGDFNDEPHDGIICKDLRASRDPEVVVRYPEQRLFNPSWWLSSPPRGEAWADFGTMHHLKSGSGTRWHALDQGLTCHQWLDREGKWAPELKALRGLLEASSKQRRMFDHVPIELTLMR